MKRVGRDASVHEATVRAVATHAAQNKARRRRPARGAVEPPLSVRQVLPEVMETARAVLRPGERIVVVSATEVVLIPVRHR